MTRVFKESVYQFIIAVILGWLIMYIIPTEFLVTKYIPSSFTWLFWLVTLGAVARGWPVAPPEGIWKPGMSKTVPGVWMTLLWLALALLTTLFIANVWPGIPLFPVMLNYGILLFMTTLWYSLTWCAYPFAKKSGKVNLIAGAIVILVVTAILWSILANLVDTPWADASFNPNGIFQVDYMFGMAVWIIAWIQIFGFSMQNYPFYKLGEPLGQILLTIVVAVLGYFCWDITLRYMSPTFSFGAIAGSIIGWTLFHSLFFGYYPNAKYPQPIRGLYNLLIVAICVVIWIPLMRLILSPILAKVVAAELPFDISAVSVFFTLHVLAIIGLAHNFFWLKMPFIPPAPPIGPEEVPETEGASPEESPQVEM